MKYLILLLSLLIASPAYALVFSALNLEPIYQSPVAHPRTPTLSATTYLSYQNPRKVGYIEVNIGRAINLTSWTGAGDHFIGTFGIDLEVGTWLSFGKNRKLNFPLLTEDYYVSLPLSFRVYTITGAFKYNHISAHLGDGMKEPDIRKITFCRDFFSLHLAHELIIQDQLIKSYIHSGWAFNIKPKDIGRWFVGGGVETKWLWPGTVPFVALDTTWNQDTGSTDISAHIGVETKTRWSNLVWRTAIISFIGKDRRGQLFGEQLRRIGIGVEIQ